MPEDLEESGQRIDVRYLLGIARRRFVLFTVPFFLGWLVVWLASWVIPPQYESTTLILVEQPTMPKDYVTPNISDDLQERLQSISQQILSRTRLLHIIDQYGLYKEAHVDPNPDEKVEAMRKHIKIDVVRDTRDQITAFNVSYLAKNAAVAQEVTGELTNLFINENLEVRQQQSEDTTKFLESQLEAARASLASQEQRIRDFQAGHAGELPTQVASNLQILAGMQSQLHNEEDSLNAARQQHVYLQTLEDQYRNMQSPAKGADGTPVGVAGLDDQLQHLRAQLADLLAHYTEQHPDVKKVKDQIARTEKMRDQALAASQSGKVVAIDPTKASVLAPVESQLRSNDVEIGNRERAVAQLKAKVDEYQGRLNAEPAREQQLADLTRGYDQSKSTYNDLLKKRNESEMATRMELQQQGERFRVVDPPSYPVRPEFPNRLKFCGIGLAFGLMLGVATAAVAEKLDPRMHNSKEIVKLVPAPVLSEIPPILTAKETGMLKRQAVRRWVMSTVVVVVILAGSALTYLRG
jgi:polysaccharide chain length determinant protein (PEP-CTERM system associated)